MMKDAFRLELVLTLFRRNALARWGLMALFALFAWSGASEAAEMRFPAPEFVSGYDFPETAVPAPTQQWQQWMDVFVLAVALSLAAWLAIKKRSRKGLFWLMIFCLLYFGFYKQGCVCPIGSIQNVTLSLSNAHYAIPVTVMIIFLLPLIFSLIFGRVFCASVCALGAIQDLVLIKPIQLPKKLTTALSMIPYIYLGLAVLLASTHAGMVICKYDPFIGFFRLNGHAPYLYLGAGFLLIGMFVARPYCRFFCPYGVLLGWLSRFSRWHLSITPSTCIDCRLCEESCPFDAIDKPNVGLAKEDRHSGGNRLGYLIAMVPVLIVLCAWIGHRMGEPLSRQHRTVALAEQIILEKEYPDLASTLESDTFRTMAQTEQDLLTEANQIRSRMDFGGWILGGFIGLVFGIKLINVSLSRTQVGYEVRKSDCYSCGRCCSYCPSDDMHRPNFAPGTPEFEASQAILAKAKEASAGQQKKEDVKKS